MTIKKTYKNSSRGREVEISIPELLFKVQGVTEGQITYGATPRTVYSRTPIFGKCEFEYDADAKTLSIIRIDAEPQGMGLGAVLIYLLTNYPVLRLPRDSRIVADNVLETARRFYLQMGFRPSSKDRVTNNIFARPPGDGVDFYGAYFPQPFSHPVSKMDHDKVLYRTSNGRMVTRKRFGERINQGRASIDWEGEPLRIEQRAKSHFMAMGWQEVR